MFPLLVSSLILGQGQTQFTVKPAGSNPSGFTVKAGSSVTPIAPLPSTSWYKGSEYEQVFQINKTGKPVFLLFTDPHTCVHCKALDAGALINPSVEQELTRYVKMRIDVTTLAGRELVKKYNIKSWPTMLVYDKDGSLIGNVCGEISSVSLTEFLKNPVKLIKEISSAPTLKAGPFFNPTHTCPNCGSNQFVVSGWLSSGQHTHTCPKDGTVWYH